MPSVDGVQFLNDVLATKPLMSVAGSETYQETVCREKGGKMGGEVCYTVTRTRPATVTARPMVTNSRVVTVHSIEFDPPKATSLPESMVISRKVIKNPSDASINSSVTLSVSGTEGWQVTKTSGVTTTIGGSVTLQGSLAGIGSGSATVSYNCSVNTSLSTAESASSTVSRSTTDNVSIGPKSAISIELLAYQSAAEVAFHAKVVLDGDLISNLSGVSAASHMSTADERTVLFDGSIRISAMSEAFLSVKNLPQDEETPDGVTRESIDETFVIYGELSSAMRANFVRPALAAMTALDNPGGIGAPDGTHYEVLYTERVFRPTPQCGFNDIGVMNGGIFAIEARQYTTYVGGQVVASWQERVERFEACWAP